MLLHFVCQEKNYINIPSHFLYVFPHCAQGVWSCSQISLTQSVREHLQPLNPLIFMKLQTINTVETIVLYQIERRVHWHLVDTHTFKTKGFFFCHSGPSFHTTCDNCLHQDICLKMIHILILLEAGSSVAVSVQSWVVAHAERISTKCLFWTV